MGSSALSSIAVGGSGAFWICVTEGTEQAVSVRASSAGKRSLRMGFSFPKGRYKITGPSRQMVPPAAASRSG